jgi:ABC-type branched-subunit amino acid transport system substrate-binding protein
MKTTKTRLSRRKLLGLAGTAIGASALSGLGRFALAAEPIKLGASLSLTGRFSDSAKYVKEGYDLWAEQVNGKGGIAGHPVQVVVYDDESNPDTGRVLAERLIDRDAVLAILGPYSSPITDAMATATERAQIPMIGTIASDSSIWSRRKLHWSFQGFPSSDYDHEGFLKVLRGKGAGRKKLAIVFQEAPFSIAAKEWALNTAKEMGLTIDAYGYAPGAQDFRSIIERIVAFGAEAVSMGGYYQPSIALTRQMIERGFNPVAYHFIQAADGVTKDALGANVEGIFGRSAWEASIETPANKAFVAAYQAKFGRVPSYHSAAAYAAGELYAAAIAAKSYGGSGLGITEASIMMQAVAESGAAMSGASAIHMNIFGLNSVVVLGTAEQKRRMLPPLIRSEDKTCFAVTEPNVGLNTTQLATRAEKRGDHCVCRGAPGCRLRTSPAGVTRRSPSWRRCTRGRSRGADLSLAQSAMSFTAIRHGFGLDRNSRDHLWPTTRDRRRRLDRARHRRGAFWLVRHDVPAQRGLTPAEAVRSPQSVARETVLELDGDRHIPFPVLVDGRRGGVLRNTASAPGADAQSILGQLGLTPAEIAALRRSGVIGNQAQDASI